MNESLAREMGTTLELLESRHRRIQDGDYPDLHEPTSLVMQLARTSPLPGPEGLKAVMSVASRQLKARRIPERADAEKLYLRRTAEEIIRSGKVSTHKDSGIHGCQDYSLVALALLRARRIPPEDYDYVRIRQPPEELSRSVASNHSIILIRIAGRHYRIDLSKKQPFSLVSDKVASLLKKGSLIGKDPFQAGITSTGDAFFGTGGKGDSESGGKGGRK